MPARILASFAALCCLCVLSVTTVLASEAGVLRPSDRVVGWVDYDAGDRVDRWNVTPEGEGVLIVSLIPLDWETAIDLYLVNSRGENVTISPSSGAGSQTIRHEISTGGETYSIDVRAREPGVAGGYILRCFSTPDISVLVYLGEDDGVMRSALERLGIAGYKAFEEEGGFVRELDSFAWDLVCVYEPTSPSDSFAELLIEESQDGCAVVITDYDLYEDEELLAALDVTWIEWLYRLPVITLTPTSSLSSYPFVLEGALSLSDRFTLSLIHI